MLSNLIALFVISTIPSDITAPLVENNPLSKIIQPPISPSLAVIVPLNEPSLA
jgi:hypothetical protein